jgi:type I restriction enzyme S subunit
MATRLIALPPVAEQVGIVAFVERERAAIDELISEAETTTALLQERRTALISAAVTGKIDVRHLAVATADATPEPA